MAREKIFRDGKRKKKKKGLSRKERREAIHAKQKGLFADENQNKSKPKRRKSAKKKKKKKQMNLGYWTEIDWVAWNRRRTSGISVADVKAETVVLIGEDFEIVETNLNVDEETISLRKKERKRKSLRGLLERTGI